MERQQLNKLARKYTGFPSFDDLIRSDMIPIISPSIWEDNAKAERLANTFKRRFIKGWRNFKKYYLILADNWIIFDISAEVPKILEESK